MNPKILPLLAISLLSGWPAAHAIPVAIDITINSPTTLTAQGSFDLDPATSMYSNLSILLTGTLDPLSFSATPCDTCPLSGSSAGLIDPTLSLSYFLQDFTVTFGGGLLIAIFRGNSFSLEEENGRIDGTYAFRAESVVPEPGTLALLALGLAGLGIAARRRA